jgi:hypothetical protein
MRLSDHQLRSFVENGFLVLRGLAPQAERESVLTRVLAEHEQKLAQDRQGFAVPQGTGGNYASRHDSDFSLFNASRLYDVCASLLPNPLPTTYSQVLIWKQQAALHDARKGMHIDKPPRATAPDPWPSFSLTIAIAIQGGNLPNSGSLGVYPGTHRKLEAHFKANPGATFWDYQSVDANGKAVTNYPEIGYPDVTQVLVEPGDVFLMHSMLAHTSMPNIKPLTRVALYFRIADASQGRLAHDYYRDIWAPYHTRLKEFAKPVS